MKENQKSSYADIEKYFDFINDKDKWLSSKSLGDVKNISNTEIEEDIFTNVHHKNSNNKTCILNTKPVTKGQLLGGNEYTSKLVFRDLSECLYYGKI